MQEVSDDTRIEARFGGRIGYAEGGISNVDKAREMLQKRAPDGEFLAYINPEEAGILKALGGAGQDINRTGVPSFFVKKIFKGVSKAVSGAVKGVANVVKKVASSDLGKLALAAAAIYAGGGGALFGGPGFSLAGTAGSSAGGLLGSGGQFGLGKSYLGQQLLGTQVVDGIGTQGLLGKIGIGRGYGASIIPSGISSLLPGKGSLLSAGAGFLGGALLGGMQPPQQEPGESLEDYQRRVEEFKKIYEANLSGTTGPSLPAGANNPYYPVYAANGGRIGYQEGGMGNVITQATQEAFFGQPQMPMMANGGRMNYSKGSGDKPIPISGDEFQKLIEEFIKNQEKQEKIRRENKYNGGRMGYAMGNSVQEGIMAAPQIARQMGMPVGNPRMNEGGVPELDYRDQGGFVPPIGIKERADDIPAMLSNNEFVFTADAVKNAGGGDPNVGAQKMYTLMKRLESGGMV
jgi:hypothetical protein